MIPKLLSLKSSQGFIKYFKNTSWLFGEKLIRMVLGLTVGVWVARYLGPEQFGLLSYAMSFVGLLAGFATLGLNNIVIRELVKNTTNNNLLLGTSFFLKLSGSFFLLVILFIIIHFTNNEQLTNRMIFIIAGATIFQSFFVIDFYFQSKVLSKYIVYVNVLTLFFSSLLKIILIIKGAALIWFAWIILFESLFMAIGYMYIYQSKKLFVKHWRFKKNIAKELLNDSWPLILSGFVVSVYMRIDQVMIKDLISNNAVGQYAVAVRLSTIWYFIPAALSSSLFPAIVNAKKHSEKLYIKRLQNLYDLMVWMALLIALPLTFLSDWVITFLFGNQYDQSSSVLMIHIWAGIFVFLGVARGGWILTENLQRYTLLYLGIGMIFNVILNYILIQRVGIVGAAYATLISQSIAVLFAPILFRKTRLSFFMMIKSLLFVSLYKRIFA